MSRGLKCFLTIFHGVLKVLERHLRGRLAESGEAEQVGSVPLLLMHVNQSSPDLSCSVPSFVRERILWVIDSQEGNGRFSQIPAHGQLSAPRKPVSLLLDSMQSKSRF